MKNRKHLQTNFFKFIVEKYNKEIQDELNDEETNLPDEELIDNIDDIEEPTEPKNKIKDDDDLNLDELIEEYNKLTNKYKTLKNDNSLYKRK
jgi:hypothetical protein